MVEYWRYPFLPSANTYLEGLTLDSLLEDYFYSEARALAVARLETSATTGLIDVEGPPVNDEADIVLGYVISRLILAAADNQALINYVALSEARRAERYFESETDEDLVKVVNSLEIINVSLDGRKFSMNFVDYVKAASKLREGNWKLANRGVQEGIVTLDRETLVRLMREVIRQHLEELPEAPVEIKNKFEGPITELIGSVSKAFVERIGNLHNVVGERQAEAMKELGRFDLAKAPPCFNMNLLDLQAGVNLAHPSRFFITTFLSSLNQDSESVMRLFATAPDFKESFTRYQVEHISGKTSGTQYSPPKCDTLVSTGVCPGPNALCRLIKHPLSYYRVMAESERPTTTRIERILLATLDKDTYPKKLIDDNLEKLKDLDFTYSQDIKKVKLSAALKDNHPSIVEVKITYFNGRTYSVDIPGEEKKLWITRAAMNITDSNIDYECLPLTDWKIALPIEESHFKSKKIKLVVKPLDVKYSSDEIRRSFIVLDTVKED
ncbi:MAG: DNA primase large subunit PriL [Candidatus Poseidoniia archaeon]|nr:DNA primase large subunit PriL [Candidatus Poseidoniia archaeon]